MCGQTVSELIVRVTVDHAYQYPSKVPPKNKRIAFMRPALLLKVFFIKGMSRKVKIRSWKCYLKY